MNKKKHHYIPASYLAGFSDGSDRHGQLYIFDKKNKNIFKNTAENVGYIKKYYKISVEGFNDDVIEDSFAEIESKAINILRDTINSLEIPKNQDFHNLLFFIALFGSRVPLIRNNINNSLINLIDIIGKTFISHITENDFSNKFKELGVDISDINYEELREFVFSDEYNIEINQNYQIYLLLYIANTIYNLLLERKWYLIYKTENQSNYFVTSDCPLLVVWKNKLSYPVGFGLTNTRVIFPLNKDVVMIGEFEEIPNKSIRVNNRLIRMNNTFYTIMSERFVYSFQEIFGLLNNKLQNISSNELL